MKTDLSSLISRRAMLKALGVGAASLPFFKLLENSAVEAAANSPPLRFLAIYVPNGYAYEYFRPRAPGSDTPGSAGETNFNLLFDKSVLAPLEPFRDKLLILDALDFECAQVDRGWGHNAVGSILTGTPNLPDSLQRMGPSLDHYLSTKIGQQVAVPKLNACVGSSFDWSIFNLYTFGTNGTAGAEQLNPARIYDQAFGNFQAPDEPVSSETLSKNRRLRSKLDFMLADINRLRARVGSEEARKLDAHLEAVRSIERRLSSAPQTLGCTKPPRPNVSRDYFLYQPDFPPPPADVQPFWELHSDIIAQAFACDRTRVATLRLGSSEGMSMPFLGSEFDGDVHNIYQHNHASYRSTWTWDSVSQAMARMQNYSYERVAYTLRALDQIQEGDGTVLDNTIVMISSEMGNTARHDSYDIIFTLAGGGGKFRMGRYLNLKPNGNSTIAHNKLLVSILHAFGIDQDTFGWTGSVGPLSGLT